MRPKGNTAPLEKNLRQRTCVGCRKVKDKRQMLRLIRTSDGCIRTDSNGNMPGRGAYICSKECLEGALKKNAISRALRVNPKVDFEDSEMKAADAFFSMMEMNSCKE